MILGFDFFLSRGLYKGAEKGRVDFYRASDRWYFLVVGELTLEITVPAWLDALMHRPAVDQSVAEEQQ